LCEGPVRKSYDQETNTFICGNCQADGQRATRVTIRCRKCQKASRVSPSSAKALASYDPHEGTYLCRACAAAEIVELRCRTCGARSFHTQSYIKRAADRPLKGLKTTFEWTQEGATHICRACQKPQARDRLRRARAKYLREQYGIEAADGSEVIKEAWQEHRTRMAKGKGLVHDQATFSEMIK
jgi:hypothetical protein